MILSSMIWSHMIGFSSLREPSSYALTTFLECIHHLTIIPHTSMILYSNVLLIIVTPWRSMSISFAQELTFIVTNYIQSIPTSPKGKMNASCFWNWFNQWLKRVVATIKKYFVRDLIAHGIIFSGDGIYEWIGSHGFSVWQPLVVKIASQVT